MALVVEQRPEEDLFVEENPTVYDTPYFTSRWNAANLPLVYKISNTKFPVNTEDVIEDILSVANNAGFAELTLDAATFTFVNKGFVEVTNTTNYNGVWQIRQVVDSNTIVINAPFIATETGNVQNYYNNYNTLIRVYSGIPEYHPLNSTNPMTLITDNPITITPNSDNEAVIDVAALIKSKINLDNDYDVNDTNIWTSLFIDFAEQYDDSDGTTVTTFTSTYEQDLLDGCDASAGNFVDNGTFTTSLTPWQNKKLGQDWSVVSDKAQTSLSISNRSSKELTQSNLGLSNGVEYTFTFDYNTNSEDVTITLSVGSIVFQETLNGTGTISNTFIYDSSQSDNVVFKAELVSNAISSINVTLDNVVVENVLANPCLAYIFSTHSAQQPQYKYGGNMGEYVQNFNGGQFANRWLTLFEKPVLFKDNYFDISTIIPQNVIQSAIQAGGFFLEVIEFDRNGTAIEENQYPITQNLGDGVYRFRLDDKDFNANTKEFTVQILRIPVNLFVDGDQGTFDTTTDSNGNPPSDWNLEKDTRAIINFDNTLSFQGVGSLNFESRSIFNDNYAFDFNSSLSTIDSEKKAIRLDTDNDLNFNQDFKLEFEIYPKRVNYADAQEYFNRGVGGSNIRIAIIRNTSDLVVVWTDNSGSTRQLIRPVNVDQWNTVVFTFLQGVSATLNVNGSSVVNNTALEISVENGDDETIQLQFGGTGQIGGGDRIVFDGLHRNIEFTFNSVLVKEYKLNQEQGRNWFDTVNQEFSATCNSNYSDAELKFDGGVWIDTTTL